MGIVLVEPSWDVCHTFSGSLVYHEIIVGKRERGGEGAGVRMR